MTIKRPRGRLAAQLRQDEAMALLVKGCTYEQIAEQMGYANRGVAYRAVQAAMDRHNAEAETTAEQGRAMSRARLMLLWVKAVARLESESAGAKDIMAAAHIADRLARLDGVKDPAQDVRVTIEAEIERDIERLENAIAKHMGVDPRVVLRDAVGQ